MYGSDGLPVCFVCFSEEHPCVFSLSASPSSPFSKDFMYTAFMLFYLMKIVWICAFQTVKKRDPLFFTAVRRLLCYSPKNWFRLFKGLFFTVLSPCVDARQAQLIFSEFEVIVLNWQTKHLSPWLFHFYRINSFMSTDTHMRAQTRWLSLMIISFWFWGFPENLLDVDEGLPRSLSYHSSLPPFVLFYRWR